MDWFRKRKAEQRQAVFHRQKKAADKAKKRVEDLLGIKLPTDIPLEGKRQKKAINTANLILGPCKERNQEDFKSPFDGGLSFGNYLERKKGFKCLGTGSYSTVYGKKSSNRVLKVCHRPDTWPEYILWASGKGYAGTYAPKVYSYKYIKGKRFDFYLASMERLDTTLRDVKATEEVAVLPSLMSGAIWNDNIGAKKCLNFLNPGLGQFAEDLRTDHKGRYLDLHAGNYMLRSDGSFCLTDPFGDCASEALPKKRLYTRDFEERRLAA
jgi:hypothetical protein